MPVAHFLLSIERGKGGGKGVLRLSTGICNYNINQSNFMLYFLAQHSDYCRQCHKIWHGQRKGINKPYTVPETWPITERNESNRNGTWRTGQARHAQRFSYEKYFLIAMRCISRLELQLHLQLELHSRRQVIYGKRQPNRARRLLPALAPSWPGLAWPSVNFHTSDEVSN